MALPNSTTQAATPSGTDIRYDATNQVMEIDSRIGNDFSSVIATGTGYGLCGLKDGNPFADVRYGTIDIKKFRSWAKNQDDCRPAIRQMFS